MINWILMHKNSLKIINNSNIDFYLKKKGTILCIEKKGRLNKISKRMQGDNNTKSRTI